MASLEYNIFEYDVQKATRPRCLGVAVYSILAGQKAIELPCESLRACTFLAAHEMGFHFDTAKVDPRWLRGFLG
jgi:hypothetical protein